MLALSTPPLCQIGQKGENAVLVGTLIFNTQIDALLHFLGVADKWSSYMLDECAALAYEEYYWFTIAELKQVMSRIKVGYYSSHKNFTPSELMKFLKQYADEMIEARGQYKWEKAKTEPIVLRVSNMSGKSLKVGIWLLKQVIAHHEARMKEIMQRLNRPQAGKRAMTEEEYQQIRHNYLSNDIKKKAQNENTDQL